MFNSHGTNKLAVKTPLPGIANDLITYDPSRSHCYHTLLGFWRILETIAAVCAIVLHVPLLPNSIHAENDNLYFCRHRSQGDPLHCVPIIPKGGAL